MQTVYSIFDMQELEHHMFAADSEVPAKDVVMAFLAMITDKEITSNNKE